MTLSKLSLPVPVPCEIQAVCIFFPVSVAAPLDYSGPNTVSELTHGYINVQLFLIRILIRARPYLFELIHHAAAFILTLLDPVEDGIGHPGD